MSIGQSLNVIPLFNIEFHGLLEYVNKNSKKSIKVAFTVSVKLSWVSKDLSQSEKDISVIFVLIHCS